MGGISDAMGRDYTDEDQKSPTLSAMAVGWYTIMVEKAEVKPTKAGDGKYLKVQSVVVSETGKGRKLYRNFNLANKNQQAVEIGIRELVEFSRSLGVPNPKDESELIDKVVEVYVEIDPKNETENRYRKSRPIGGAPQQQGTAKTAPPSTVTAPVATSTTPETAATAAKKPWMRK